MKLYSLILLSLFFLAFPSCGNKEGDNGENALSEQGEPIGAPAIKPPVERNTPSGFLNLNLVDGEETTASERLVNAVQRYLAPAEGDAVGAIERLGFIDNRLAELDTRAQESKKDCLEEDAEAHTLPTSLPDSETFTLFLQCQENLDGGDGSSKTSQLAFGLTEENLFLFERTGLHGNAVLASAKLDESRTEFWQLGSTNENGQNYIHLAAGDDFGMEMTAAGTEAISSLECGLHMKSNDTHVYIEGRDSVDSACGEELLTVCVSATDFTETELSDCTSANLDDFTLTSLTPATIAGNSAKNIIETSITGYTQFSQAESEDDGDDDEEEEEDE